eukprot:1466117-Lingulodinium_polyedra.AAC.1
MCIRDSPYRKDTVKHCNELLAYATRHAHGNPRDPDVKDAITVMLCVRSWKAEERVSTRGIGGKLYRMVWRMRKWHRHANG